MMPSEKYTIIVSGQRFTVTRAQLESEPGNYFTTYFFGDFQEAAEGTNELEVEKDPLLFAVIQSHLRGYDVLPLTDASIPVGMSRANALKNLLKDADFFGLERLVKLIRDEINNPSMGKPGQRIYQLSVHKGWRPLREVIPSYVPENADGLRRALPVSSEAVHHMLYHPALIYKINTLGACKECYKISPGWEAFIWLTTGPYDNSMHYIVESKIV